jgi:hypothetical protein
MDLDAKDKMENKWVQCWRKSMGITKIPHRVMRAYVDLLNLTVNELDKQLCWECWPEDLDDASGNKMSA